jgi:hypothetical protein
VPCCCRWRFHRSATVSQEQQITASSRKLAELRQAIGSAATPQELQTRVQKVFGPNAGLSPTELRTPMPELRQQLLGRAEQASSALMQQIEAQSARKPDSLVKETLSIAISALAYAIGFAFLAGVLPRAQAMGINRGVEEEYFEKLVQ